MAATGPKNYNWRERFFGALRMRPILAEATAAAGITRETVYLERRNSPEFCREMDTAIEEGLDHVETILHDVAKEQEDVKALIYILNTRRYKRNEHDIYDSMLEGMDHEVRMVWEDGDRDSLPD